MAHTPAQRDAILEWSATEAQKIVQHALKVASDSNFNTKADPAFVGAIISSITTLYVENCRPRQYQPD